MVGLLSVHDGDIGLQCRHGGQGLAGERALDLGHGRVGDEISATVAAHDGKGQPCGAGRVAVGHAGVAVLLDLQWCGPPMFDSVAEAVQRADPGITPVGEHKLARSAHPDHLVIEHVGGHADELELAPSLTQQLVTGRERDQVGEALHGDAVAVVDEGAQGIGEGDDARHRSVR